MTMAELGSSPPSQSAIELTVDLVALLEGLLAHRLRVGALQFDLIIGTKGFDHRIEALTRPWHQLTKPMDGDPIVVCAKAVIGALKLLTLGLRLWRVCCGRWERGRSRSTTRNGGSTSDISPRSTGVMT